MAGKSCLGSLYRENKKPVAASAFLVAAALLFTASIVIHVASPHFRQLWTYMNHHVDGTACSECANSLVPVPKATRFHISNYGFPGPVPWEWIRAHVRDEFTLGGRIQVRDLFFNTDALDSGAKPYVWVNEKIDRLASFARARKARFGSYGRNCTTAFFQAFDKYSIKDKKVLVIGSQLPWVESICLGFDASTITTVDFNKPIASHPKLRQLLVDELEEINDTWDVAVSFSSLEHDGLGRYGDPMNPNGDLDRMQKIKGLLKPGGLLFLGVPVGNDTLLYNAHRIYGPIRMPLLLSGWKLLGVFGVTSLEQLYRENLTGEIVQPVMVLTME